MSRKLDIAAPAGRPETPVDASSSGGRLRSLRKLAAMDQQALADMLGVSRTQVSKYETNGHPIPDHIVTRAAQLFAVSPSFLRYGDLDNHMARVIGRVGAGGHIEAVQDEQTRYVEVPASWHDAVALEVSGTSCWPVYDDGDDIVIRGDRRLVESEILGKMCVVETIDGLGLVKRVRRGSTEGRYMLESPNAPPIEDVELASARPVRLHAPR